jgi:RNA polymerase subunit RPABC4/transcription elongation factor Spt4
MGKGDTMWKCLNEECGAEFEKPKVHTEYFDGMPTGIVNICPICSDSDVDELGKCSMCKTYITSEKDRCPKCEERTALWLEEAIGNIQSDTGAERSEVIKAMVDWIEKL